ncbi:TPA: hypothetical protein ACH3X2_011339 [Trebouxia sp. C0005]
MRRGRAPADNSDVLAMFRLVYSGEGATQPLVDDSSEEADPSCSASTLSNEEYASLLDAAMRFPDKQVGLCVAAMASCGLAAGFRSDDLQDTRYFMELICSVPAEPLPMQILALANNAGKANQDAQMTYAALANHRQPHLNCRHTYHSLCYSNSMSASFRCWH